MNTSSQDVLAICVTLAALFFIYWKRHTYPGKLPPGPKPLPLIGNIHQLPVDGQELVFSQWAKQYGDVVFARFFGTPVVILNSQEAVDDLLVKRSANYSDRPPFVALKDLVGWKTMLPLMRYGNEYRKQRAWYQAGVASKPALQNAQSIQRREVYVILSCLLQRPDKFEFLFTRYAAAVLLDLTYGYRVTKDDDELVLVAEEAMAGTAKAGGGFGLILDFFPILRHWPKWLPGSDFRHEAAVTRQQLNQLREEPYKGVLSNIAHGTASPSFLSNLLERYSKEIPDSSKLEFEIKNAAATIYGAGTDTLSIGVFNVFMTLVKYPRVFKKAREEMDRVVGQDRLPDFSDRPLLQYLNAVMKEAYRWHPPFLLALPHKSVDDDFYKGHFIPGRSIVLANVWNISQNEAEYPDPQDFRPERYLGPHPESNTDPKDFVFGFGRRVCVGKDIADASIFILIANLIATMDISKANDETGKEIDPPYEFMQGVLSRPKAFRAKVKPRSEKAVKLIEEMHDLTNIG